MKYQEDWIRSLELINDDLLLDFSNSLKKSTSLAVNDAKSEYNLLLEEIKSKTPNIDNIYKLIIKWKTDFLYESSQEFCFISKYSEGTLFHKLKGDGFQKIAKVGLDFFYNYKKHAFYDYNKFKKDFCDGLYRFKKSNGLYEAANNFIYVINNENIEGYLKLPLIENFEVDVFTILAEKNINSTKNIILLKNEIILLRDKKLKLKYKIIDKKSEISELKRNMSSLQNKIFSKDNYIEILHNEISKNDYYPVNQFNELYWGDNYPALKVLFDFLQRNCIVGSNWSYFASLMSLQNLEPINFSTGVYNKKEIGYLFKKIQSFFTTDYKNTGKRYIAFLQRKFRIDYDVLDDNFCKNNIRNYKKAEKTWVKTKQEIDVLCQDISKKYF